MAKKPTVTTVASGYYGRTALNDNFTSLRDAFDNTLSRDGSTPNTMSADIDLNSNDLLNVASISAASVKINGVEITVPTDVGFVQEPEYFSGDGSTTDFVLTAAPGSVNALQIYIDGIKQKSDSYTLSSATVTFSEAPPTGTGNIEILYTEAAAGSTLLSLTARSEAAAAAAEIDADRAELFSPAITKEYDTVASLLASIDDGTILSTNDYVRVVDGNYVYQVVASGGDVTNAGGVQFDVLVGENGYNVKAFGVAGDGVTDDTLAIQAAIDKCEVDTGGTVYFPASHYIITAPLEMKDAVILQGAGRGVTHAREGTILEQTTSNTACINAGTPHDESAGTSDYIFNIAIRDMSIWAVVGGTQTAAVLYFGGVVYSTFDNLSVYGGGNGIEMGSSFLNSYRQVDVVGSALACFYFNGRAADNSFVTCSTNRSLTGAVVFPEAAVRFAGYPDSLAVYYQVPAGNIFTKCDFTRPTYIIDFENQYCGSGNIFEATYSELTDGVRIQDDDLFSFATFEDNVLPYDTGLTAAQKRAIRVRNFIQNERAQSTKGVFGYNGLLARNINGQRFDDSTLRSVDTDRLWCSLNGSFGLDAASAAQVEFSGVGKTDTTVFSGPYSIGSPHTIKVDASAAGGAKIGPARSEDYIIATGNRDYLFCYWYKPEVAGVGNAPLTRFYRSFSTLKNGLTGDPSNGDWQNLGVLLRASDFTEGDAVVPILNSSSSASVYYVADLGVRVVDIAQEKKTAVSENIDLSGAAFSDLLVSFDLSCVITSVRLIYSEASSADAGVTVNVGNQSSATAFASGVTLTSQPIGTITELLTLEKYAREGDALIVACGGGKTGAGAVKVVVDYIPMTI